MYMYYLYYKRQCVLTPRDPVIRAPGNPAASLSESRLIYESCLQLLKYFTIYSYM